MKEYALLSLSNKEGLESLARALLDKNYELLASGGTFDSLQKMGLPVLSVSEFTGEPERFDGRVKTLHHKIFGSLLLRGPEDHKEWPFDFRISVVAVNFYPFQEKGTVAPTFAEMIELIDIGGPTLVRAAAKNYEHVYVLTHPSQYARFIAAAKEEEADLRRRLALEAFKIVEELDSAIVAEWGHRMRGAGYELKYGENPHQPASYEPHGAVAAQNPVQTLGPAFSYNNFRDAEVALRFLRVFENPAACVIKHQTLCGAAAGLESSKSSEIFEGAWEGDPVSRYGGIVGFNFDPSAEILENLKKRFLEVLVVPYSSQNLATLKIFCEEKKSLKVLLYHPEKIKNLKKESWSGLIGKLEQSLDHLGEAGKVTNLESLKSVFGEWTAACSKSNAMVLIAPWKTDAYVMTGAGQGQPNRVDALKKLAIPRAQDFSKRMNISMKQMTCFSDAFLPFPDNIDVLKEGGVLEIYEPGGSKADPEVKARAEELGVRLVISGQRHFLH